VKYVETVLQQTHFSTINFTNLLLLSLILLAFFLAQFFAFGKRPNEYKH